MKVKRVLEIGVGTGEMTAELAKKANFVYGIDISRGMLKRASGRLAHYSNVKLQQGRLTEVELNEPFDLIFCCLVLGHVVNDYELQHTTERMKGLSDLIFLCEQTSENKNVSVSKFTKIKSLEDYAELLSPFRLIKSQSHDYVSDPYTFMLFEK